MAVFDTFSCSLAYTGEYGNAAVLFRDVADELLDQYRLAYAGSAEQTYLTASGVWRDQVDNLDACFEDLG